MTNMSLGNDQASLPIVIDNGRRALWHGQRIRTTIHICAHR
jgi:hypothetical protein